MNGARGNRVIPLGAYAMHLDVESRHDFTRHLDAGRIGVGNDVRLHRPAGRGAGMANVLLDQRERPQGTACPGFPDFAEQPMFNWVPLRGTRGIMTDRHRQLQGITHLFLQLPFPHARAGAIAAPTIRFDPQAARVRIALAQFRAAPLRDIRDGERRGIGRLAAIDGAAIEKQVINAIGDRPPERILGKSWASTISGCCPQPRPRFLKFPINSFFLVSTLITGCPAAWWAARCVWMERNWVSRSGWSLPLVCLTLARKLY